MNPGEAAGELKDKFRAFIQAYLDMENAETFTTVNHFGDAARDLADFVLVNADLLCMAWATKNEVSK